MKTLREMIEVMQAADKGGQTQRKIWTYSSPSSEGWLFHDPHEHGWNWNEWDYRVKPKPREIWCNEYRTSSKHESYLTGKHYNSRDEAEAGVSGYDRIAIVRFVEAERIPVEDEE